MSNASFEDYWRSLTLAEKREELDNLRAALRIPAFAHSYRYHRYTQGRIASALRATWWQIRVSWAKLTWGRNLE
jgi:hypothetical protein